MDGLWISSSVACMKLFPDLRRFLGRLWPCSGCLLSFTCFSRSRWAVPLLLTAGGAIPARRYKLSTLVGCRHSVMARQASFSTGSTLCACANLSHTGHAYSVVEYQRARAVVLMVDGCVLHFEFASSLMTLFLAAVFAFTFVM